MDCFTARATARTRLRWMPSMFGYPTLSSSSFTSGRRDHGLDQFIGMVLDDKAQTVLADLGAGSAKETY
jgi:hypothetical protein